MVTRPVSTSSAMPRSKGSEIIVSRFLGGTVSDLSFGKSVHTAILFVWCIRVALQRARLQHRLTEFRDRIRNLDLDLGEQPPEIVQYAIEIQLSCANQHMFTALFNLRRSQRVRFIDGPEAREHLWKFRWSDGLNGHFEHGLGHMLERTEDV